MTKSEKKHVDVPNNDPIRIRVTMKELNEEFERSLSNEKRRRVVGYSNSREMIAVLNYNDNDVTHGLVQVKPYSRGDSVSKADFRNAR